MTSCPSTAIDLYSLINEIKPELINELSLKECLEAVSLLLNTLTLPKLNRATVEELIDIESIFNSVQWSFLSSKLLIKDKIETNSSYKHISFKCVICNEKINYKYDAQFWDRLQDHEHLEEYLDNVLNEKNWLLGKLLL